LTPPAPVNHIYSKESNNNKNKAALLSYYSSISNLEIEFSISQMPDFNF